MSGSKPNKATTHAMTVDVEDYFHVSAFDSLFSQKDWPSLEHRVNDNTRRLLDLFDAHNAKSTFFILGAVAEKFPDLITEIDRRGHEVASHGFAHQRATTQSQSVFKEDVYRSKSFLEDTLGKSIAGYRAPSFSINDSNQWAYEILVELGFKYSSSTYPIEHDLYGVPNWPRFKYERPEGIIEIPIPTIRKDDVNTGIGGGGYFRLFPYWLSKRRINKFMEQESAPYSFYFHPWEIDPNQPRVKDASFKSKFRHYINLDKMEGKIARLLTDYQWDTMQNVYLED
ncbi:XrtA system polysaccharide deacetylase [Psychrosphaera aestuarii]|uniref:XrtA system polysaccharide deacetylase n=1 Tax=Psychrosphaera aestuarii TaxID=1266052 RepID=UPI001B32AC81|nr:XrtA system polysaccharide deacetylase [Psychrosphaera aestuarii]